MKYFVPLFICALGCSHLSKSQSDSKDPYDYLLFEPEEYDANASYSLLIFLHGSGERGDDKNKLRVHGPPMQISKGQSFPGYVLAPQCPFDVWWTVERLEATLQKILAEYKVDKSRIYLTGLSMGGYGTWKWACRYPEHFAAIAPICGGGDPEDVQVLRDIPIWAFHGAKDEVVPLSESQKMIDALTEHDIKAKLTVYPEADHDSWTETYDNPEFYKWLYSWEKKK